MANFAEINENNVVVRVLSVDDSKKNNGQDYLANQLGLGGRWVETFYDGSARGKYAGIDDIYDEQQDIFISPEHGLTPYLMSWNGHTPATSPSIMIDSVARSGNIFLSACISKAFPTVFQRWGYKFQHNTETFDVAPGVFDLVVVPLRQPLDSAGSWLSMTQSSDNQDIINVWLDEAIILFNKINQKKASLKIVGFEDFVANPDLVMQSIALDLGITATEINIEEVESDLTNIGQINDNFYSLPSNNKAEIETIKQMLLDTPEFAAKIQTLQGLYNNIIS
jgi:hypothetical protein